MRKIEQSMLSPDQDAPRLVELTDRRPDFCAEAISPRFRIGLLVFAVIGMVGLAFAIGAMSALPAGVMDFGDLFGVMFVAALVAVTFAVLLVFGALVANNPRLHTASRMTWYAAFLLAGPVAVPLYWMMHVQPVAYEPLPA